MKTNEIKIEIENIKVYAWQNADGAAAEITGTYHGKKICVYVAGGSDEDGNFERLDNTDCETSVEIDGKLAVYRGLADGDCSLPVLFGFIENDDDLDDWDPIYKAVNDAFEEFLEEYLGPALYVDGYMTDYTDFVLPKGEKSAPLHTYKQTYFVMEATPGAYREATRINATSLANAKRIASRNQVFQGTDLSIGLSTDEHGFVLEPIAVKAAAGRWENQDI